MTSSVSTIVYLSIVPIPCGSVRVHLKIKNSFQYILFSLMSFLFVGLIDNFVSYHIFFKKKPFSTKRTTEANFTRPIVFPTNSTNKQTNTENQPSNQPKQTLMIVHKSTSNPIQSNPSIPSDYFFLHFFP